MKHRTLLLAAALVACRPEAPTAASVATIADAAGTFSLVRRTGGAFPQRIDASATDTTYRLGGSLVVAGTREFRLIDSLRVAHRGTTAWESSVFNSERVGFGSLAGNFVLLTWQGGGIGDLIVFNSVDDVIIPRGTDTLVYRRRR